MNRRNTALNDLLSGLKELLQTAETPGGWEHPAMGRGTPGQPGMPKKRWHTLDIPDAKTVIVQNELNCCPKDHPWDGAHGTIQKGDKPMIGIDRGGSALPCMPNNAAFADLYMLATGGATVVPGADVPLNFAEPCKNVGFSAPQAVVQKAGNYSVYYGVNVSAEQQSTTSISVAVNGVPQAKTYIPILATQSGEFSGKVILALSADDVVTIRNVPGGGNVVLAGSPSAGAQLVLALLD